MFFDMATSRYVPTVSEMDIMKEMTENIMQLTMV